MVTQPNILFILIDDLGWRDLACYGSEFYETPRLDRLAREGMLFTQAYASCPVCSPTRASIMSGKSPARVGITQFIGGHNEGRLCDVDYLHYLPLEETSLATALREEGYQTWHVGKWHLGDEPFWPEKHGFDVNIGGNHAGMPHHGFFSPYHLENIEDGPEGEYLTDRLTEEALRLIADRDPDRPFFLNLWHYAVHIPIQAPERLVEKYRAKAKRLRLDAIDPFAVGEHYPSLRQQENRIKRRIVQSDPVYAAMMENLDVNLGRVLDALDAEGLAEDTLVVFTSDNGGLATSEGSPTCNLPLAEGKGWAYEGGARVCQIIRWPGRVAPDTRCHEAVTSTDFYPTLLEAAGAPLRPEQHCDGVSLLPLLEGADRLDRDAIFWHYPHYSNQGGPPAASVVAGPWKLILHFEDERTELFFLPDDISETRDRSAEHPDVTAALLTKLRAWQQDVEAKIPEPNPEWEAKRIRPEVPNNAHE
ncbi:MAG: sulfatase [Planctomycetota bacterium]